MTIFVANAVLCSKFSFKTFSYCSKIHSRFYFCTEGQMSYAKSDGMFRHSFTSSFQLIVPPPTFSNSFRLFGHKNKAICTAMPCYHYVTWTNWLPFLIEFSTNASNLPALLATLLLAANLFFVDIDYDQVYG